MARLRLNILHVTPRRHRIALHEHSRQHSNSTNPYSPHGFGSAIGLKGKVESCSP